MNIQGVPEERYLNKERESHSDKNQKLQNPNQRGERIELFSIQINSTFCLASQLLRLIPKKHLYKYKQKILS